MQNRYFGDVGDFGKYGLLRALCGAETVAPRLRLGVVWYLFPDESHNSDGKHLGYLQKPEDYRVCDPQLFQLLQSLLFDEFGQLVASARHTTGAEAVGLLPTGTIFYSEPLKFPAEVPFAARSALRVGWFEEALVATKEADLIFLDPDNGIECASVSRTAASGPKYVYWDDINAFASRGQSLIIYHHLGRNGTHAQQIERLIQKARTRIPTHEISAIKFRRGSGRVYLVLCDKKHAAILQERLNGLVVSSWRDHFTL